VTGSRVVVLGSCGAWPEPARACSGFVLEHDGFRVVIDLGYGTLPRLLDHLGSVAGDGVDAVVITHLHPDHMVDLHGFFRARWFGSRGSAPIPVYAGAGVRDRLSDLEDDQDALAKVFTWHDLPHDERDELGPFRLTSVALPHVVPNAGVRFESDGLVIAYTGDTGPDAALAELGRDADLFIVEASDRSQQASTPQAPPGEDLHLTGTNAGEAAADAGAKRLMLTHFWPGNDREITRELAAAAFDGPIVLADEGLVVDLD
jgi:ribonuclease BN (tRNA processing enzyme)